MRPGRRVDVLPLEVGRCRHPEWVTLRGGRFAAIDFPSVAVLLRHPERGAILFDTGYADAFEHATAPFPERLYRWITPVTLAPGERLTAQLARHGVAPEDVSLVLISHLHADHVAGLRDLPRARFVAMRAEVQPALRWSRLRALTHAFLPALLPPDFLARLDYCEDARRVDLGAPWTPFGSGYDLLGDGSLLGVHLPGHSGGQMGLVCRDAQDRCLLLAADACWSARAWREQRLPSPFARWLMHDMRAYRATLAGLQQVARAQPELVILPSHCTQSVRAYAAQRRPGVAHA